MSSCLSRDRHPLEESDAVEERECAVAAPTLVNTSTRPSRGTYRWKDNFVVRFVLLGVIEGDGHTFLVFRVVERFVVGRCVVHRRAVRFFERHGHRGVIGAVLLLFKGETSKTPDVFVTRSGVVLRVVSKL